MANGRSAPWPILLGFLWLLLAGCGAMAEGQEAADAAVPTSLPGVDLTPLTADQQAQAMKIFTDNGCDCGCGMTVVECRTKDPNCGRSPVLAAEVVRLLAEGKTPDDVVKVAFAAPAPARPAAGPAAGGTGDMVFNVPTGDSYAVGPAGAVVTIVTWLDYQ